MEQGTCTVPGRAPTHTRLRESRTRASHQDAKCGWHEMKKSKRGRNQSREAMPCHAIKPAARKLGVGRSWCTSVIRAPLHTLPCSVIADAQSPGSRGEANVLGFHPIRRSTTPSAKHGSRVRCDSPQGLGSSRARPILDPAHLSSWEVWRARQRHPIWRTTTRTRTTRARCNRPCTYCVPTHELRANVPAQPPN